MTGKKETSMRILIVEDDTDLSQAICFHLKREGYLADECHNGGDAMHFIRQGAYDLIILDRMLPELSGMDILSQMRTAGIRIPVIITTALDGLGERIRGLDGGADDYLVKPFAMEELLARIRAISRRPVVLETDRRLTFSDLSLNPQTGVLEGPSGTHTLSKRETELLEAFLKSPRRILPRAMLLARVWGPDAPVEDGNLDNYIHFLRRRLRTSGSQVWIRTVRSVGYIMEEGGSR